MLGSVALRRLYRLLSTFLCVLMLLESSPVMAGRNAAYPEAAPSAGTSASAQAQDVATPTPSSSPTLTATAQTNCSSTSPNQPQAAEAQPRSSSAPRSLDRPAFGGSAAAVSVTPTSTTVTCALYPIALSAQSLVGVAAGSTIPNIFNGTQPGNVGWLTWTGNTTNTTLATSLTPPGDSSTYTNPNDPTDHVVSIGDWVRGRPGVSGSSGVTTALNTLETVDITVPVWDTSTSQGGQQPVPRRQLRAGSPGQLSVGQSEHDHGDVPGLRRV